MKNIVMLLFVILGMTTSTAQIKKASLSPRVMIKQQVGLANISLNYGQPNAKGRPVFGKLIPFGKLWRTGANSATKITFDQEVLIDKQLIPAGTYALYTIPQKKEWTIIIHKNSKLWGTAGYNKTNDLLRFKVPAMPLKEYSETLSINFENFHANGGDLVIKWEKTQVRIPVFVDSDALVFKQIEEKLMQNAKITNAQTYFDAAMFYYEKNKDLPKALSWFDKAIELRPQAFWYRYYRAELAFVLGNFTAAKQDAELSLKAAKANTASDYGYIAKCNLLLAKIADKL